MNSALLPTRKDFLLAMAGAVLVPQVLPAQSGPGKLLIVVAHPDDEYAFAATIYRLVRESGWTADQVVITDGESGFRYAALAESFYGVSLAANGEGRANLSEIRKKEARNAGRILGIRQLFFLDQRDLGFDTNAASADSSNWDRPYLRTFLSDTMSRERYDVVFTLLPTAQTHGHHRAATLLALEAATNLAGPRPLIVGAEPRGTNEAAPAFSGLPGEPLTRTVQAAPALVFDRAAAFGFRVELSDCRELADRRAQITRSVPTGFRPTPVRTVLAVRSQWRNSIPAPVTASDDAGPFQPSNICTERNE